MKSYDELRETVFQSENMDIFQARDTAYEWHGGQSSALYSFASTDATIHTEKHRRDATWETERAIAAAEKWPRRNRPDRRRREIELDHLDNLLRVIAALPARTPDISTFEVLDHGEDGAQYFPGCPSGTWANVVTGRGDTGREALEDALDIMATSADEAHLSPAQLAEAISQIHNPDKSAHASLDPHEDCESAACDEWAHWVSIRFNTPADESEA